MKLFRIILYAFIIKETLTKLFLFNSHAIGRDSSSMPSDS